MQGEPVHQLETIIGVTLDPPLPVVHKLGNIMLTQDFFDVEERLSRREQQVFALLAETDPPVPRQEVARRLGYTGLDELSHAENEIFSRLSHLLPERVKQSRGLQKLAEERAKEHEQLLRFSSIRVAKTEENPAEKLSDASPAEEAAELKIPTEQENEPAPAIASFDPKIIRRRADNGILARSTFRQMDQLIRAHNEDTVNYIANSPVFRSSKLLNVFRDLMDLPINPDNVIEVRNLPARKFNSCVRRLNLILAEGAPHILGFPDPQELSEYALPAAVRTKALVIRHYPGRISRFITELAERCNKPEQNTRLFLKGTIHPPVETFLNPLFELLSADAETRNAITESYMRERLQKVLRLHHFESEGDQEYDHDDVSGYDDHISPTPLQQLNSVLQKHGLNIKDFVSDDWADICDVFAGSPRPRHITSRTYAISARNIARLELRIMLQVEEGLPPEIAGSDAVQHLIMASEAEAGELKAKKLFIPSARGEDLWATEDEQRKTIVALGGALEEHGLKPATLLASSSETDGSTLAEKMYNLLTDPSQKIDDIYYALHLRRRSELVQLLAHTIRAFTDALPDKNSIPDAESPSATQPIPGQYLSELRRSQKEARGNEVSIKRLLEVTGVSSSALIKFLRGTSHPPLDRLLIPLAHHLGVDETKLTELVAEESRLQRIQNERAQAGRKRPKSKWNKTGRT